MYCLEISFLLFKCLETFFLFSFCFISLCLENILFMISILSGLLSFWFICFCFVFAQVMVQSGVYSMKSWKEMCVPLLLSGVFYKYWLSSIQVSHSVVSDSLWPHESQHARPPWHHQLPEFTETHIHQVSDAIQPSHPLSSPSPPAPNPSQHQSLFQWVNSSHEVAKVLEFQL